MPGLWTKDGTCRPPQEQTSTVTGVHEPRQTGGQRHAVIRGTEVDADLSTMFASTRPLVLAVDVARTRGRRAIWRRTMQARRQEMKWGGVFCKNKSGKGGMFCKKWTFPQRRVYNVQYQYFYFTFYLFGGEYAPNAPPPSLPTGLQGHAAFRPRCPSVCLSRRLTAAAAAAGGLAAEVGRRPAADVGR